MAADREREELADLTGRAFDPRLFRRLLAHARPHARGFFVSMLLLLVLSFLTLSVPFIIGRSVDLYLAPDSPGSESERWTGLLTMGGILCGIGALVFSFRWLQMLIINKTGQEVIHDLRRKVFAHISHRDLRFFDRHPVGSLVTRVTGDIETLNEFFISGVDVLISDIVRITIIAVALFFIDVRMALATLLVVPLILGWAFYFQRHARKLFRKVRGCVSRLNAFMNEALSGIDVLKIFRREGSARKRFGALNEELREAHVATVWNFSWFFPGMEFLSAMGNAAILLVGSRLVLSGDLAVGKMYSCSLLLALFIEPLRQIADKYNILQAAVAAGERVFRVLDDHSSVPVPAEPASLDAIRGDVRFEHVHFAYAPEKPVLKDITFHAPPGTHLALVGPTGSGKSTIISLLSRFYDPDRGRILLDGIPLTACDPRAVRRRIGVVLQDVFLFAGSVRENLSLGDSGIDDDTLMAAARIVQADRIIARLGGLDAVLTERASTLSTGEKQLLAFARTLAHDPAILVLDEATSNIDTISESLIQTALDRLIQNRTAIIIAHRLSTIQRCDRILVIHHGELREQGTHAELLAKNGIYARLHRMQFEA